MDEIGHVIKRPYAAIHVRRTDKIARGGEAKKHEVWEYMEFVDHFFDNIKNKKEESGKRALYVATDEKAVIDELNQDYGDRYEIINFKEGIDCLLVVLFVGCFVCCFVGTATAQKRRGNPIGVVGVGTKYVMLDIAMLANSDFMVGTFSSQISSKSMFLFFFFLIFFFFQGLAYELKTTTAPTNGYLRAIKPHLLKMDKRVFKGKERYFQTRPKLNNTVPIVAATLDDWWYFGT